MVYRQKYRNKCLKANADPIESEVILQCLKDSIPFFFLLSYYYIFMLITPWSDSFAAALNNTLNASAQALSLVSFVCVCMCDHGV